MTMPRRQRHPLPLRLKITAISLLSFVVTTACSLSRLRSTLTPDVTCYSMIAPTEPPTPEVLCYEMVAPTAPPTPTPMCYTPSPPPTGIQTPTPPTSPLPTPTPTSTSEARHLLLERLLAEGRFPQDAIWQLNGRPES